MASRRPGHPAVPPVPQRERQATVADVLVEGDRIVAVGTVDAPSGARRVDGRGKTLIPGLHDLHTHTRSPGYGAPEDLGKAWAGYLLSGVTTINDFSVSGEMIGPIRELVKNPGAGGGLWAPHLNQAVRFGVPGGHGTEAGWGRFFTLETPTPRSAEALASLALSYDPDVLKVFADGWRYGRDPDLADMNEPTLAAIVGAAHARGKPVVTHTVTFEGATVAAAAGVDALGHGIGDAPVDAALIDLMRARGTDYIPTLVVYEPLQTRRLAAGEAAQLNPGQRALEARLHGGDPAPVLPYDTRRWTIMQDNIRRLKRAGIPIGIGSDAGIEGIYHGPGAVREIGWLTRLGFTPAEALVAATRLFLVAGVALVLVDETGELFVGGRWRMGGGAVRSDLWRWWVAVGGGHRGDFGRGHVRPIFGHLPVVALPLPDEILAVGQAGHERDSVQVRPVQRPILDPADVGEREAALPVPLARAGDAHRAGADVYRLPGPDQAIGAAEAAKRRPRRSAGGHGIRSRRVRSGCRTHRGESRRQEPC